MSDTVHDIELRAAADEPLLSPSTWTAEQQRQADLMVRLQVWQSFTVGSWWQEYGFALRFPEGTFTEDHRFEFGCTCDHTDVAAEHPLDLARPCVFVDEYATTTGAAPDRMRRRLDSLDREIGGGATIGERFKVDGGLLEMRERVWMRLADGRGIVVQARYLDAATELVHPDRWLAVACARLDGKRNPRSAAVLGQRDGEDVALIMAMVVDGAMSTFPPAPRARDLRSVVPA